MSEIIRTIYQILILIGILCILFGLYKILSFLKDAKTMLMAFIDNNRANKIICAKSYEVYGETEDRLKERINEHYDQTIRQIDDYLEKFYTPKYQLSIFSNSTFQKSSNEEEIQNIRNELNDFKGSMEALNISISDICRDANEELKTLVDNIIETQQEKWSKKLSKNGAKVTFYPLIEELYKQIYIPESSLTSTTIIGISLTSSSAAAIAAGIGGASIVEAIGMGELAGDILGACTSLGAFGLVFFGVSYCLTQLKKKKEKEQYKKELIAALERDRITYLEAVDKLFRDQIENINTLSSIDMVVA